MQHETALSAAHTKQADTRPSELSALASKLLNSYAVLSARVVEKFVDEVIDKELIYPLAEAYLKARQADMRNGGGAGLGRSETHTGFASPSPTERDGRGPASIGTQPGNAAPSRSNRDGRGQTHDATQALVAPPVREPSPLQKSAAGSMRLKMAETVLDTFRVRDGRAIGHVYFREIPALTAENAIEASVLRQVQSCAANIDPSAQVGDVVKAKDLEAMIAKAKKDMRVAA
jgi:hypothetical protein